MGKRKRFQASTALAGMMNRILPKLQEQGWEHHYVTINHGKGPDIYKCGNQIVTEKRKRQFRQDIYDNIKHK